MAIAKQQNSVVVSMSGFFDLRRGKLIQFVFFGLGLSVATVRAQPAPDAGALQRELQLQLQRELTIPQVRPVKPLRQQDLEATGEKITLAGFKYQGNTLFSSDEINSVTQPWLNKPLSFIELREVTVALQNFYSDRGRIAQASFPPQDIENGIVLIAILEGRMGKVDVKSDNGSTQFSAEYAKKFFGNAVVSNELIDTQPLERGLMLLNEVPGVRATAAFEAGTLPGTSDFKIGLFDTPFFSGQASLSNYGSSSTGVGQAVAALAFNNLTGAGDQVNINAIQSLGSSYAVASYNRPIGANGLKAGAQATYLTYQTLSSWSDTQTQGSANSASAFLTYALTRKPTALSTLKLNVEQRNYNNLQAGNTISNYQINAASLGISASVFEGSRSVFSYGMTYTLGQLTINEFMQAVQDQIGPGTSGTYSKLNFNLTHKQELTALPSTSWTNSVYGQLANKNLNSSEQIYMGGPYGVRAYPLAQGGGSQGAIMTSELAYKVDNNWQVSSFFDVGVVQQYVSTYRGWQGLTNANNFYVLGDVGVSGRFTYRQMTVDAVLAYRVGNNPLYTSTGQQLNTDNSYKTVQGWLRASFYF
jgi:hemolysin activation/secretion protein